MVGCLLISKSMAYGAKYLWPELKTGPTFPNANTCVFAVTSA